jgi:hypothetical protein
MSRIVMAQQVICLERMQRKSRIKRAGVTKLIRFNGRKRAGAGDGLFIASEEWRLR